MGIFEEFHDWKHIGTGIHHDEEEYACQVQPRHIWIVTHDLIQQVRHLLD